MNSSNTISSDLDILSKLCCENTGMIPMSFTRLPQAGGDRTYWRMEMPYGRPRLGVKSDSEADAKAYVRLSRAFRDAGVNVAVCVGFSPDYRYYIVEDLGDTSLFSLLGSDRVEEYVAATIRELVKMQTVPPKKWSDCVAYKPFSKRQILWDLNYFKYEYLKPAGVTFDEDLLEDDFECFAEMLLNFPPKMCGFMMRDCQSRNVMMKQVDKDRLAPYFIDFQGGRMGPCIYDAVSLLWQAKAGFSDDFRRKMINLYADKYAVAAKIESKEILARVDMFALFRTLQVLGAYGYRGLVQKRAHFIESIPAALKNLTTFANSDFLSPMPELRSVIGKLVADKRFEKNVDSTLRIKIFSFSYKKGYPEDYSGNGGGFMFDCRGMHNPGRYDEFKPLTGLDKPVIEFLKERGEADTFVSKALDIVSPSVETYLRRGFNSLQIGFGCTGGRHRSVYCAEGLAAKLKKQFPLAIIEVNHREQNIHKTLS